MIDLINGTYEDDDGPEPAMGDYSSRVYDDKMNPDIKAKWVEALRSGRYPQSQGSLNRQVAFNEIPAGFCCLGVLCEIGVQDGVIARQDGVAFGGGHAMYRLIEDGEKDSDHYWADTMPSPGISAWAGLDVSAESDLAEMNDGGDLPFAEIAAFIEERL